MVKALVIVAHPDDETIWCGGTILSHPGWEWAVLSLCRRDDADRAPKFRRACKVLGAKCAMSDLEDENPEQELQSLDEIKSRVKSMLGRLRAGRSFDVLYTHGANGEYGHNRHIEVHRAVKEMIDGKQISSGRVCFFNYRPHRNGKFCVQSDRGSDIVNKMGKDIKKKKFLLVRTVYRFNKSSFESMSCSAIESFKVKK